MRFAVSIMAALETQEDEPDSKLLRQDGAITALTVHTRPALSWAEL
jgi:hypothetical protein